MDVKLQYLGKHSIRALFNYRRSIHLHTHMEAMTNEVEDRAHYHSTINILWVQPQ